LASSSCVRSSDSKAVALEVLGDLFRLALAVRGQAHKHMGARGVADAVVELGHVARAAGQAANHFAKAPEAAALFGDGDGQQRLALFAHFGALGHEAQAVEVHVGAAQNGRVGLAPGLVFGHILLDGGHGQGPAGSTMLRVSTNTSLMAAHTASVSTVMYSSTRPRDAEGFFAHQLDGGAVREQAHVGQRDALMRVDRLDHGVRVVHLHANHLDLGPHGLDVVGHARHQAAAANGHKHGIELVAAQLLQLAQDFHGNRALAGNHVGVVKGVHKGQALLFLQPHRVVVGIRIAVAASTTSPPSACTASILSCGVVVGITTTARVPSLRALMATPCAWLPAEAQITPFCSCSGVRWAILL
jgi:hypothetical protein